VAVQGTTPIIALLLINVTHKKSRTKMSMRGWIQSTREPSFLDPATTQTTNIRILRRLLVGMRYLGKIVPFTTLLCRKLHYAMHRQALID
jgi:hypothetical protein